MSDRPGTVARVTNLPLELLHAIAGSDATFRQGQREAIDAVVAERRRVLLVQRTGWGKSAARMQWPSGLVEPKGRISEELRLQPGRALSVLNDGGWGGLVRKGLQAGEFSDALIEAAAELVGKRWRPDPRQRG